MAEGPTYKELAPPSLILYGVNKEKVTFSVFNGAMWLNVFVQGNRKPTFSTRLEPTMLAYFKSELKKLLVAPPGTSVPLMHSDWIEDTKKYVMTYGIVLAKDDKQVCSIEVKSKDADPTKMLLKTPTKINVGNDPMSDAEKSNMKVRMVLEWFEHDAMVGRVMFKKKWVPEKARESAQPSNSSSSDDLFS